MSEEDSLVWLEEIKERRKAVPLLRTFRNPMRDDGLFVAEDRQGCEGKTALGESTLNLHGGFSLSFMLDYDKARFFASAPADIDRLIDELDKARFDLRILNQNFQRRADQERKERSEMTKPRETPEFIALEMDFRTCFDALIRITEDDGMTLEKAEVIANTAIGEATQ